jgi:hypothetical protein
MTRALLSGMAATALACAGCFQVHTADVRVRDTSSVELTSRSGEPVLPEGAVEGEVQRGKYYDLLTRVPYDVRASRDSDGGISLHCDACGAAGFPHTGTSYVTLLGPDGRSLPTSSWSLAIEPKRVVADYDVCLVSGRHACTVDAQPRMVVPMSEVLEVRRRAEPLRFWGYALLGMSAVMMGVATAYTFVPQSGTSLGERAAWGTLVAVPALGIGAAGLWEVLAPVTEQTWRPPVEAR